MRYAPDRLPQKPASQPDCRNVHKDISPICPPRYAGQASPSHVLTAIGLSPELAFGSLRITFGMDNTKEDVDFLLNLL